MDYTGIIIPFVGGLGMFIYGMQIMAQGLENAAGNKMKSLLEVLTKNKFFGVLLGAFITAVIQSSSATTVMVVGFVNAGIMNLTQAMGVIMGANIGTTVTGWLVSSVEWAKMLSPANLAPIAIIIGVVIMLTGKRRSAKDISSIIVGFGILFVGISTMSGAVSPLKESEAFCNIFVTLGKNPFLGILAGTNCDSCDPEFFCICRNPSESCSSRTCSDECSSLYHYGTEHRYMCDSDAFQCWSKEKCKDSSIDAFAVQCNRYCDFQYCGNYILYSYESGSGRKFDHPDRDQYCSYNL